MAGLPGPISPILLIQLQDKESADYLFLIPIPFTVVVIFSVIRLILLNQSMAEVPGTLSI